MFISRLYIIFLISISYSVLAQKSKLFDAIQPAVYELKTNSSKGAAFAIGKNLVATTFSNIADVSDVTQIILSRKGKSDTPVQEIVAASFYKNIAILKIKRNTKNFLEKTSATYSPFYLAKYQNQLEWTSIEEGFYSLSDILKSLEVRGVNVKNILSGAPILNRDGKFLGMVNHLTSRSVFFIFSEEITSVVHKSPCANSLACIEKEKNLLKLHMESYVEDPKHQSKYRNKIFHLKNVLEYAKKHFKELTYSYLETGAQAGSVEAQFHLGLLSIKEGGIFYNRSFSWLQKAAQNGHSEAQFVLGMVSLKGVYSERWSEEGINKNSLHAVEWLQKAAQNGHSEAQFVLGVLHYSGHQIGLSKDFKEAFDLIYKAALQNHPDAQFLIFKFYLTSIGVSEDKKEAVEWLQKAAQNGHSEAQFSLSTLLMLQKNKKRESQYWLQKAAQNSHIQAQLMLSSCSDVFKKLK